MSPVLALPARDMDPVRAASHVHLAQSNSIDDARRSPFTSLNTPLSTPGGSHRRSSLSTGRGRDAMSASSSANTSGAAHKRQDSQGFVCLCTPAPKIPRPRNAFILYRQHHQAQVTADNPRLSNPDISKIIGSHWRRESDMEKQRWKTMADEEKQRHQNQYPNYRYQPRRTNKPQDSWPGSSPTDERCPKCNGRLAAGSQTPLTSTTQSSAVKSSQSRPSLPGLESALSCRKSIDLSSPSMLPSVPRLLPSVKDIHLIEPPSPPDGKRRRADDSGSYHAVVDWRSSNYLNKPPALESRDVSSPSSFTRTPLPELRNLPRSQNGAPIMPPPPLLPPATSWLDKDASDSRTAPFDESLRLPPLQAPASTWPPRGMSVDARQSTVSLPSPHTAPSMREAQTKTLRDAIMSIPTQDKIAVLASICQPIPPLATDGDQDDTRGAFISIEGADAQLLREVGDALQTGLETCRRYMVRVWRDDKDERLTPEDEDASPFSSQPDRHDARRYGDMFEPYLNTISAWQKKSRQIGRYVTGKTQGQKLERQLRQEVGVNGQMPVALARDGFSLTIADRYACAMPIVDMYAPTDHWQWMATLWRGTVSPDLIVYVMSQDEGEARDGPSVELSRREGLVTVKLPADRGLDEATSRRLVFEVLEWMQQESFLHQVPQGWRSGGIW